MDVNQAFNQQKHNGYVYIHNAGVLSNKKTCFDYQSELGKTGESIVHIYYVCGWVVSPKLGHDLVPNASLHQSQTWKPVGHDDFSGNNDSNDNKHDNNDNDDAPAAPAPAAAAVAAAAASDADAATAAAADDDNDDDDYDDYDDYDD